jgi:hypothetical protein
MFTEQTSERRKIAAKKLYAAILAATRRPGWIAPACGWRTYSITSSAVASCVGVR